MPDIRFPEFTDAWEQRKLGDHAEVLTGGTPRTSILEYWEPKEIPWMSSGEVNKRRLDETNNMISEEGLNNSSARWVKEYSVLIALAGQGKTRGTVAINNIPLTTNQSIAAIVPDETLYYEFIFQNLIKRYDELRMISSGDGTRGGLNKQIVSNVVIPYTSIEEQKIIGTFFNNLDHLITLHQRKLELLKDTKKSLLQKMFPKDGANVPEIRFPEFTDAWEQRKLGEVVKITMGQSPDSVNYTDNPKDAILVQGNADMKNGRVVPRVWTTQVTKEADIDDLILSVRAPVGDIGKTDYKVVLGRGVAGIKGNEFVFQTLGHMKENGYWTKLSTGSTFESINSSDIREAQILIPIVDEQQKIGSLFAQLDNLITLHQRELEALKESKKAFLQKMFI